MSSIQIVDLLKNVVGGFKVKTYCCWWFEIDNMAHAEPLNPELDIYTACWN